MALSRTGYRPPRAGRSGIPRREERTAGAGARVVIVERFDAGPDVSARGSRSTSAGTGRSSPSRPLFKTTDCEKAPGRGPVARSSLIGAGLGKVLLLGLLGGCLLAAAGSRRLGRSLPAGTDGSAHRIGLAEPLPA
jgi:hypothetical protein